MIISHQSSLISVIHHSWTQCLISQQKHIHAVIRCCLGYCGLASLHGNGLAVPPHCSAGMHPASFTTGATATCWAKPSHSKDKQGTVGYSCCCHRCYQTTTRSLHRPNSAICFSIWGSQWLNMLAELLMSLTNHQPVPNSVKFCRNVEILRKRANSAARLKIPRAAENCGP